MVDNVAITAGSGTTIAADDIGAGLLVQRVKVTWGPDGTANDADVASGKAMPVQLRDSSGTDVSSSVSRLTSSATNIAPGSALATTSFVTGGRYDATQKTLTDGQEASWAMTARGAAFVAVGADGFATTATLAAETTKVIGTVNLSAAQTLATVTNLATIAGTAPAYGSGANGATVLRVALATDSPGIFATGMATPANSISANPPKFSYETVAASQTAQVLGGTGATGDYLAGILVIPATTSPGNVLLIDNATSITVFTGGAASVSNLVPFMIPIGAASASGAWKLTTGTNVSCIGIGNFSA